MAGTGFIWFWKNDQESWTPYSDQHQDEIERARIQGEDHVILQIGTTPYLIDFCDQVQENLELGHRRLISRANEFTVWYWRDDDGQTWNLYDPEQADALTRAEAEKEPEVYLVIHEALYRIDLPRRLQINFDNHTGNHTREIRQGRSGMITQQDNTTTSTPPLENPVDSVLPDEKMDAAAPKSFLCPISFHIMEDPVTTSAGSTYDRKNIVWWLKDHDTDPLTKRPVIRDALVPNNAMNQNIEDWKQDYKDKLRDSKPPATIPAKPKEELCDDTLKVVFLGSNQVGTTTIVQKLVNATSTTTTTTTTTNTTTYCNHNNNASIACPGVHIYDWRPTPKLQFHLWDFEGQDSLHSFRSMAFTPNTLFAVVWDMGLSSAETDLERDISTKVQFWVDRIRERVPKGAVIFPVASFPQKPTSKVSSSFSPSHPNSPFHHHNRPNYMEQEAKRRCQILKDKLVAGTATLLFDWEDPVVRVHTGSSSIQSTGLNVLQQRLIDVGRDSKLFRHIGRSPSDGLRTVRRTIRNMKEEGYKMTDLEEILANAVVTTDEMNQALQWLSQIGEVLHFLSLPPPFNAIIILDIPWFFGLCGCILRHDWKVLVNDGRRRKGKGAAPTFGGAVNANCPVVSKEDASMLWLNHLATSDFGRSPSAENFTLTNVLDYLQTLMIHMAVLVPVDQDVGPLSSSNLYAQDFNMNTPRYIPPATAQGQTASYLSANLLCIPNLLRQGDHGNGLNDTSFGAGSTTRLARKVQFQSSVPDCLMEKLVAALLRNITTRMKEDEANGAIELERIHCWRSVFRIRFSWKKDQQETTVEVSSQLVEGKDNGNQSSLVTSASVVRGDGGLSIWKAGFGLVLETLQAVVEGYKGLKFATTVYCQDCLASRGIHESQSWGMGEIDAALEDAIKELKCGSGHIANLPLLADIGSGLDTQQNGDLDSSLMKCIVLVGLYDARKRTNKVKRFGSGVIVDAARGLIVTSARNVMTIQGEEKFGQNYDGILGGKVVIGVMPDGGSEEAVFRYYAKIVSKDPALTDPDLKCCRVDACVLKITSRFESDVEGNGDDCCDEIELLLRDNPKKIAAQRLVELPTQTKSNLEDRVSIFGFDQSDEGHVNRGLSHVAGYICQKKSATGSPDDRFKYRPLKTTVVMAEARPGYTGGPCLNQQGEFVGILACGDPDEESRSFVVPTSEWEHLVRTAA